MDRMVTVPPRLSAIHAEMEASFVYDDGDLTVRPGDYIALARGRHLGMPRRVLFLLFALAHRPQAVVTRSELGLAAWGPAADDVKPRAVDQAVSRLRHSLALALPELDYIHTHKGLGYRFERVWAADDPR
jgi:DNA-binding response OmpR family regulator